VVLIETIAHSSMHRTPTPAAPCTSGPCPYCTAPQQIPPPEHSPPPHLAPLLLCYLCRQGVLQLLCRPCPLLHLLRRHVCLVGPEPQCGRPWRTCCCCCCPATSNGATSWGCPIPCDHLAWVAAARQAGLHLPTSGRGRLGAR
jgi:hypothetical protein